MEIKNYSFHKTGQFRNVIKHMENMARFKGVDEGTGEAIIDQSAVAPTVLYQGAVKLHGTNASIILHKDGTISFHSKSQLLGYISPEKEFTLLKDNAEFAQTMWRRKEAVFKLVASVAYNIPTSYTEAGDYFPIKISGEWCGPGIQKGVGISNLPVKSLFIFGVKTGGDSGGWLPPTSLCHIPFFLGESGIHSMSWFKTQTLLIDFSKPKEVTNILVKLTEEVENCCPVTRALKDEGVIPEDAPELGEGLVWMPCDKQYVKDSGTWFKTKGEKHSATKVKTLVSVDIEKLRSIEEFVAYSVTPSRLSQGIEVVGLDQKKIGDYIRWVCGDINKEEGDTLESNGLSMKDVGKPISTAAKEFYFKKLNSF